MEIKNKRAYFDYYIEQELEAGIELKGTEIKSIRQGSVNLKDSFARIKNNEVYVLNMFIAKYDEGNRFNHEETRERKLLLHKKEILKMKKSLEREGYSLIPLKIYLKKNKAKLLLGVARGKKLYDKREVLKNKQLELEAKRNMSY